MRRGGRLPVSWLLMAVLVVGALVVGGRAGGGTPSARERAERIAEEVRCPTCEGLSVAESEAPASRAIRTEIRRRIDAGQSDAEIREYLVSRFGKDILLKPETGGVTGLVWFLPVVATVLAAAGLGFAFSRWRARPGRATEEDRLLVERVRGRA